MSKTCFHAWNCGILGVILALCACSESAPTEPAAALVVAPGSITTQVLPVAAGWQGGATAGSANGTILGRRTGSEYPQALWAWTAPYTAPPVVVDMDGIVNGGGASANGDAVGWKYAGPDGAWLMTSPGIWTYQPTSLAGNVQSSLGGINAGRQITGAIQLAGMTGNSSWRATFYPAPDAEPILLPLPAGTVGAFGIALNNPGDVVGYAYQLVGSGSSARHLQRPVLWRRTGPASWTATLLPNPLPSGHASARSINDAGQIVGMTDKSVIRWTPNGATWTQAIVVSGSGIEVPRIDGCGRVVGTYAPSKSKMRGFVWDGSLTLLPLPPSKDASDAEDFTTDPSTGRGVIVGKATKGSSSVAVRWTIPSC